MLFLFGDFALDTDRRELRRGSALLSIEPQVFDLLVYLIRNRGRVAADDFSRRGGLRIPRAT